MGRWPRRDVGANNEFLPTRLCGGKLRRNMDRLTEFELFVKVAESGTLWRAAEALGMSNPAASRHLLLLWADLKPDWWNVIHGLESV
jgi:Bacterial regulatory helix-turn-helix protein, lysR family